MVTSASFLVFTTDVDGPVEETSCDNCGVVEVDVELIEVDIEIVEVLVEIVDETVRVVVSAGSSHFTLTFPLSPP